MWEMKRLLAILVVAAMFVLSIGCTSNSAEVEQLRKELDEMKAATPTATPTPTPVSRIAFMRSRDWTYDPWGGAIFVMDVDGTNLQQLTNHDDEDWRPAWSPGGNLITFASWSDEAQEIFVMDAYLTKAAAADKAKAAAATKADKAKTAAATKAEDGDPYPTKTKA